MEVCISAEILCFFHSCVISSRDGPCFEEKTNLIMSFPRLLSQRLIESEAISFIGLLFLGTYPAFC
jgi:hypothetical protein